MAASSSPDRRRRVARGVYQQPNGKYAVCVRVDGRARFRTLQAATLAQALKQRELLQRAGRHGDLPLSPRLTFAEVAGRWLADFEAIGIRSTGPEWMNKRRQQLAALGG